MNERKSRPQPSPNWDRVDGVIGKEKRESLADLRVAVIGQGSLGSEIARLLAMAGVGKFTLVDPDKLDASNVVRHVAGLTRLGEFKVKSVGDHIKHDKNPAADIWAVAADARLEPLLLARSDLVIISGLGSNARQAEIAEITRNAGVTTLVAGVYQAGKGGEVFVIRPDEDTPCYSCIVSYLGKTVDQEKIRQGKFVYGLAEDEIQAVPALAIDVNRIATIAADFALKLLLHEPIHAHPNVNLLLFANKRMKIGTNGKGQDLTLEPLETQWVALPKDKNCLVCTNPATDISLESLLKKQV